ncbi:tyrosine-type recombinase/integrase [Vibrio parahaemolyticus]
MKNFVCIKSDVISQGMILLNIDTSEEYRPFEEYVDLLIDDKGYSNNTVEQYSGHVSRFLDFLYELRVVSTELKTTIEPYKVFRLYEDYLLQGTNSEYEVIRQVAENIGKTNRTSHKSISEGIEASLSLFMSMRLFNDSNDDSFLRQITQERDPNYVELSKMVRNSWLAATMRLKRKGKTSVKLFRRSTRRANRASIKVETQEKIDKSFPINRSVDFFSQASINSATRFTKVRDFLLYSLLAATGIRTSEALQITIDDIDWNNRSINVVSPFTRKNVGLTPKEESKLFDKGRATSMTFMIQPFASIFWSILNIYMSKHYKSNVSHRFIFQKINGRPYFSADRKTRSDAFKKHISKFDKSLMHLSLHGFRLTYAFYTLNYLPIVDENGNPTGNQGLPITYVKILLGHQNLSSTEVYAKEDTDLIEFMLSASNGYMRDQSISFKDLQNEYYDRQIKKLELEKESLNAD